LDIELKTDFFNSLGYFLPSAGTLDHDRFTPQSRHPTFSRPESG
jgi:hypothetical protein